MIQSLQRNLRPAHGRHLEQIEGAGVRAHERSAQAPEPVAGRQAQRDAGRPTLLAHLGQHGVEGPAVAGRHVRVEFRTGKKAQPLGRRRIGLDDAQIGDAHHNRRFGGGVEQHLVAGFDLAKAPMVPLALLLRLLQTRLQIGNRLQVPADGDKAQFLAEAYGGVFERQFAPAGQPLLHLETGGGAIEAHGLDHFLDLRVDLGTDRLRPAPSTPGIDALVSKSVARHGIANDAVGIQRQRDVRLCEAVGDHRGSRCAAARPSRSHPRRPNVNSNIQFFLENDNDNCKAGRPLSCKKANPQEQAARNLAYRIRFQGLQTAAFRKLSYSDGTNRYNSRDF